MRILHVIGSLAPRHGGPSKACVEMAKAVMDRGHEVTIFTTDQDGPARLNVPTDTPVNKNGVKIHYFRAHTLRGWPCVSMPLKRALKDNVRKYDIVHIHSLYLFHGLVAAYCCRKYGVPYLIRPCGALDPFLHKRHRFRKLICELLFENRDITNAAAIHFTTEEEKQLAQPFIHGTRGVVAPLGLNLSQYDDLPDPGIFRSAYPEVGSKRIILFFGRINFKKGLDILIDAFARVARRTKDVHLVLAGPDNEGYGSRVKNWVTAKSIGGQVTFTGMLQGKMKYAVMQDAAMFILPSYTENFGISVVEAMACGLPVIISNKVNIWRKVVKAGAGLAAPCDAARFAELIVGLLDNPKIAAAMGEQGRVLVKQCYSWLGAARTLERIYHDLLAQRKLGEMAQKGNGRILMDNHGTF